jgi:MarR family transcriptional regulator, organic hydroperoxide resistance regulator
MRMDARPYDHVMATRKTAARPAPVAAAADAAPDVRVLRQFRVVFNSIKTHFRQVEKRAGLGGAQVWALSVIRDQPDIGVSSLARALDVKQPTASNLVRSLVEQDLVEVKRDSRDGRAVKLRLRPAGSRALRRAPGPFAGVLPEALAALDTRTLARLEDDLAALIQALKADERGAKRLLSQM